MRCEITFQFNPRESLDAIVDIEQDDMALHAARKWMDDTWEKMGCEPIRPSGKVLLLDKILGIAEAYGFETLSNDISARETFSRHIAQALGKPRITVDLPGLRIGY